MPKIPVVEFLRVSTAEQAEEGRAGLARQQAACAVAVERHGLAVVEHVELVDVSGTCAANTPEMAALLALLRAGRAKGLVVADFDRLLRADDFRSFGLLQDIQDTGAHIYMPDQVVDLASQAGFLMGGIQSLMAGNERRQILKRSMEAKEAMRRRGEFPGGAHTLPMGVDYDRKTRTWSYNEEAELVREMFRLYAGGVHNYREIGRLTGVYHRRVIKALQNEIYIGFMVYDSWRRGKAYAKADGRQAGKRKVQRPADKIIRVQVMATPLIDEATFWKVQDHIRNRKNFFAVRRKSVPGEYLFSRMLRCGHCGQPMYTGGRSYSRRGPGHYFCRTHSHYGELHGLECPSPKRFRRDTVDGLLLRFIAERLASEEYLLGQLETLERQNGVEDRKAEIQRIEDRHASIAARKQRALGLYLDGRFEKEELDAKIEEIQRELDGVNARLRVLQRELEHMDMSGREQIVRDLAAAFCEFRFWSQDEQRELLEALQPEFYITEAGVVAVALPMRIDLEPPYPFLERGTLEELGLEEQEFYTSQELAAAFGETPSGFSHKVREGIYIEAQNKKGLHRHYTPEEALENYMRCRTHRLGLPIKRSGKDYD